MRFLIIFIFLITNSFSSEVSNMKNIVINKVPKKYDHITFLDIKNKTNYYKIFGDKNRILNLNDYKGNLILVNFWATWCVPCKDEMPSLDLLQVHEDLSNLKIFPINVGKDSIKNIEIFFKDLKIQNLSIYFDSPITLAKKFKLRGIPTSILFNKNGEEIARIIGLINFEDEIFINWLSKYN